LQDFDILQSAAQEIGSIVRQASSEQIVRQALVELDQWSVTAQLKLITRTDASGQSVSLIKDYQEVLNKIGDNQSLLQSAKNSAAFDIATFHNTIGDRMIPCQRPIMLKNALELQYLVQSETVAWQDESSVQRYVDILQTAVSRLSTDNTLLVGYHEQAKRTVCT